MEELCEKLGMKFGKVTSFQEALTHSSYNNDEGINNKKLAFLGDAVLGFVISLYIHQHYPHLNVGEMSEKRAYIVNSRFLYLKAKEWGLGKYLRLGKGEIQTGGRKKETILAEVVEALIGAIYLDFGFDETASFILRNIIPEEINLVNWNFKGKLQEFTLSRGMGSPEYTVIMETKDENNNYFFKVNVKIDGRILAEGVGKKKREAEVAAARRALEILYKEEEK